MKKYSIYKRMIKKKKDNAPAVNDHEIIITTSTPGAADHHVSSSSISTTGGSLDLRTNFSAGLSYFTSGNINDYQSKACKNEQMVQYVSHQHCFAPQRRFIIIMTYVSLWTSFYIMIHHYGPFGYYPDKEMITSQSYHQHDVFASSAILITAAEVIKLLVSVALYLRRSPHHTMNDVLYLLFDSKRNTTCSLRIYLPPAFLYAIYNNLMFWNLKSNGSTFYLTSMASSSRLLITTVLWQKFFKAPISCGKKGAIVIITIGIFVKDMSSEDGAHWRRVFSYNYFSRELIIIMQLICGIFASIFNERLLKKINSNQHLQNICLYINSIGINIIIGVASYFAIEEKESSSTTEAGIFVNPTSLIITISILSFVGILTSTLLLYENTITKEVASASETVVTSIIEYLYFGQLYKTSEIFGIMVVSVGTLIYSIPSDSVMRSKKKRILPNSSRSKRMLIFLFTIGIVLSHLHQTKVPVDLEMERTELDGRFTFVNQHFDANLKTIGLDMTVQHNDNGFRGSSRDFGIISCIQSREDTAFALELAYSLNNLTTSDNVKLELYHHMTLSPYLIANLEILGSSVRVIKLKESSEDTMSCIRDALSLTEMNDVLLIEPSFVVVSYDSRQTGIFTDVIITTAACPKIRNGRLTSTSQQLDDALHSFLQSQNNCKFHQVAFYADTIQRQSIQNQEIILSDNSTTIGTMHTFDQISFIAPKALFEWASYYLDSPVFYCKSKDLQFEECDTVKTIHLLSAFRRHNDWKSLHLLDREVGWVAFDGGLVLSDELNSCHSFNSVNGGVKSIEAIGSDGYNTILNIDLVMTQDEQNIAMHSYSSFDPVPDNVRLQKSPSEMTLSEVQNKLHHPCLSRATILKWFDQNPYRFMNACDGCLQEISTAKTFLDEIVLKGNSSLIFDLKATGHQMEGVFLQAKAIAAMIYKGDRSKNDIQRLTENVNLRFFAEDADGNTRLEVLPIQLYTNDTISSVFEQIKIYVNVPTKETCLQIIQWSRNQNDKIHIAGCFVIENHSGIKDNWKTISRNLDIKNFLAPLPYDKKLICDVPREQMTPNAILWKRRFIDCVENGYDWIHAPFPVGFKSNYSPAAPKHFFSIMDINEDLIKSTLSSYIHRQSQRSDLLSKYVSHWGITSPHHWSPKKQQWSFTGFNVSNSRASPDNKTSIFRCVTKILTVMLFLRLEELELISLDDLVVGPAHNVTWKQVFTNTAKIDGIQQRRKFQYSNSLWSFVPSFIHNITGAPFIDAIKFYVLDPIGLSGVFDTKSPYLPYAARGFVGSTRDLLLIGSTLASGGISPETRLRVLSQSSVRKMLEDWTSALDVSQSFKDDKIMQSMSKFYDNANHNNDLQSVGVVDGYGMGIWRVSGWRTRKGSVPVRGWIAMGSSEALMYFDEDDIVVGMCAPHLTLDVELTVSFASTVKEIGHRIDKAFKKIHFFKEKANQYFSITK